MSQSQPDQDKTTERVQADFAAEGVTMTTNGRVRIPARLRDMAGIEGGDVLHVTIRTDDAACDMMDIVVTQGGMVRVPKHKRDLYDLSHGKRVTLEVEQTGLHYEYDE